MNVNDDSIDHYVKCTDNASIYHLTKWGILINRVFKHDTYYFYAKTDLNNIVGVLPLVRIKSRLFGDYMISMPFFNYGGAIGNCQEIEEDLMNEAISLAKDFGVEHIEFRDSHKRQSALAVRTDKVNMILQLPTSVESLSKSLGAKIRSQIKRPLREEVLVMNGGIELVDDFYKVFARNMRDLGTPVYPKKLFIEILNTFSEESKIFIVRLNNKTVGAAFLLGYQEKLEIPWASTINKYNYLGINMLMYWEIMKYAIENKYKKLDFGRSTVNGGTYRFKKQWGAKPLQLYWNYWLKDGNELPQLNPTNKKYKYAIKIWKHLPIFITNRVGPRLVKNLP